MPTQTFDFSKDREDMTCDELCAKIARRTGHRPPKKLTKPVLNSLHAWLTGEFYSDTPVVLPGRPPRREMVEATVTESCGALCGPDTEPDECPFAAYREHLVESGSGDRLREFRRAELLAIVDAMDATDDQRSWTGE